MFRRKVKWPLVFENFLGFSFFFRENVKKIALFGLVFLGRGRDGLYAELWKACAGPLVDVPQVGERVFYFPQGHMEQVSVCVCVKCYIFVFRIFGSVCFGGKVFPEKDGGFWLYGGILFGVSYFPQGHMNNCVCV
jgi:hypothetical protein